MAAPERTIRVGTRTVLRVLLLALAVFTAAALLYLSWRVITWMLIALFLALALTPAVAALERRGAPRTLAAVAVFLAALLAAGGLGYLFVPPLVEQVREFVTSIPDLVERLSRGRGPLGFLEEDFDVVERARQFIEERGVAGVLGLTAPAVGVLKNVLTTVLGIVSVIFLTLFMLIEGPRWVAALLGALPEAQRDLWERVFGGVYRTVSGWVMGVALIALLAGTVATVAMLLLGVPFALPLGLLVAVLDPIPFVGATVAALVVALVAWATEGLVAALVLVGVVAVYQQIENHVVYPLVYGRTVPLSPLGVLLAVLVGAELAGIIGAILAIPIAGSAQTAVIEARRWRAER